MDFPTFKNELSQHIVMFFPAHRHVFPSTSSCFKWTFQRLKINFQQHVCIFVFLISFFWLFHKPFLLFCVFGSSIYVHSDVFFFVTSIQKRRDFSVKMHVCLLFQFFVLDRPPFRFRSSTVSVLDRPHFYSRFKSA